MGDEKKTASENTTISAARDNKVYCDLPCKQITCFLGTFELTGLRINISVTSYARKMLTGSFNRYGSGILSHIAKALLHTTTELNAFKMMH